MPLKKSGPELKLNFRDKGLESGENWQDGSIEIN
jgi:hypothetical protein